MRLTHGDLPGEGGDETQSQPGAEPVALAAALGHSQATERDSGFSAGASLLGRPLHGSELWEQGVKRLGSKGTALHLMSVALKPHF